MTTILATIGEGEGQHDVSADIVELDTWLESLAVGRWQLVLKNVNNKWGDDFHTNDVVELRVNDISLMKGYVDDVMPHLDERGVYTNMIRVVGRDYARDLARLYCTADYGEFKADAIIDNLLYRTDSEITFIPPLTAPLMNIARRRTYLIDWIRDIAQQVNYEAYVSDLKVFRFKSMTDVVHTAVDLKSVAASMTNNILRLEKGEEVGFSIANCIELSAGSLKDHYTDMNARDWTPGVDTYQPENENENEDLWRVGIGSIKFGCTKSAWPSMTLDFSGAGGLYSHEALDMSQPGEMSYYFRHTGVGLLGLFMRPRLEDSNGNIIEFKRGEALTARSSSLSQKGWTGLMLSKDQWHKLQVNIGETEENAILNNEKNNRWYYIPGGHITTFDWKNIVKITFKVTAATTKAADIYIDDLCIPTVEVISIAEDAVSQAAYGKAMFFDQRNDIRSQIELDVICGNTDPPGGELEKRKDPLRKIRITAIGQTLSRYAGQSLDVQAPGHGITELTEYRIVTLHHMVRKDPILKGYDFVTEYDLVKHTTSPDIQIIDPLRFRLASDPRGALIEVLNLTRRRLRTATATERTDFGDTHPVSKLFYSGHGDAFPEDPEDGFIFRLDMDITGYLAAVYEYDEDTGNWIRDPITLHRDSDPPSGTEVTGDILFRTDENKIYQWSGSAWVFIGTSSHDKLTDVGAGDHHAKFTSGDHAAVDHPASMLKKGIQPYHSNIKFSPKTDATHNQVQWTAGIIEFADGTSQNIDAGSTSEGIPNDEIRFIYFTVGSTSLTVTSEYGDVIGDDVGLLAVVGVSIDDDQEIFIQPFYSKGLNIIADVIAAGAIFGRHITATEWITAKMFQTGENVGTGVAGIRFDADGIRGYDDANPGNLQFYIATDGQAYCGGGAVILDSLGIVIKGQFLTFQNAAGSPVGYMKGSGSDVVIQTIAGNLKILSAYGLTLDLDGDIDILSGGILDIASARLIVPTRTADPPSPRNGEIWLRTDL